MNKDTIIEIRPIPGRNGIQDFSQNLEFFSQSHTIAPFVNPETLRYVTGLSEADKDMLTKASFPYNIEDVYKKGEAHEFWESSLVKTDLSNGPSFLYPGKNLLDFVKYKYLLVNNYIYNSEEELKTGSKSEATHYIFNEAAANKIEATRLDKRNDLIVEIKKLSLIRKRQIVLLILNENTDVQNEEYLTVRFEDIMKNKEHTVELELLLKEEPASVTLSAEIKKAIQKNVLKRTSKGIFYFETNLGFSIEEVKSVLEKDENQEVLLSIKSKL